MAPTVRTTNGGAPNLGKPLTLRSRSEEVQMATLAEGAVSTKTEEAKRLTPDLFTRLCLRAGLKQGRKKF